jgi:hypothetical protein
VPVRARQSLSLDGRAPPALDTGRLIGRRVLLAEDNLINQVGWVDRKLFTFLVCFSPFRCFGCSVAAG